MKRDKLQIGQKIIVLKKPETATSVVIGDIAVECGFSGSPEYQHQFHSYDLVDTRGKRENYWVEFLPRDCYQLLTEIKK